MSWRSAAGAYVTTRPSPYGAVAIRAIRQCGTRRRTGYFWFSPYESKRARWGRTVMSRTEWRTATNVARPRPASGPHLGENLA
jgi:hypothetical protein